MSILNRLRYPKTDHDWSLFEGIPNFPRRLAIASLRELLNRVTYGPIWEGQPMDLRDLTNTERLIEWPVASQVATIFKKGLPFLYETLKWAENPPQSAISYRDAFSILSVGFQELYKTQAEKDRKRRWPKGINKEKWLQDARLKGKEFIPLRDLIDFWENRLRKWIPTFLIHGSCATLDHIPGSSDLDTLMIIGKDTFCNPDELAECVREIVRSQRYLLKFNPYMHHGHMLVTDLELRELREASFPLCLVEKGITFGLTPEIVVEENTDLETLFSFQIFEDFFERKITKVHDLRTAFDLLWWTSTTVMIPVLFMQIAEGRSRWKPNALHDARRKMPDEERNLIDYLTDLRKEIGKYLPRVPDAIWELFPDYLNPGIMVAAQKGSVTFSDQTLISLGITEKKIRAGRQMFRRMSQEALKKFYEANNLQKKIHAHSLPLNGRIIKEFPVLVDSSMYELTKEFIIERAKNLPEVFAIYQFGQVCHPGLSDIDLLVVMQDRADGYAPFFKNDLPEPFREIMGHDPIFLSAQILSSFPKVFPLFDAKRIYGEGPERILPTPLSWPHVLPILTVMQLAKYPVDIVNLCRLAEISFKTVLAFLHSFEHYARILSGIGITIPPMVVETVEMDRRIRKEFLAGDEPRFSETNEILILIFRATAAISRILDEAWQKFCPKLPSRGLPFNLLASLSVQFSEDWTEEMLVDYCLKSLLEQSAPLFPFPVIFGWFLQWLSQGTGVVSEKLVDSFRFEASGRSEAEFYSKIADAFKSLEPYKIALDKVIEVETTHGRVVSKYISLLS